MCQVTTYAAPVFAAVLLMCSHAAWAQSDRGSSASYPNRPIRIVVPFAAGGPSEEVTDSRQAPGARHPVFRTHPVTGRKALHLGRRLNGYIVGLPLEESEQLLDELWRHASRPEFAWAHEWRMGDVLVWDNRCLVHRRDAFDPSTRRKLTRVQITGISACVTPRGARRADLRTAGRGFLIRLRIKPPLTKSEAPADRREAGVLHALHQDECRLIVMHCGRNSACDGGMLRVPLLRG